MSKIGQCDYIYGSYSDPGFQGFLVKFQNITKNWLFSFTILEGKYALMALFICFHSFVIFQASWRRSTKGGAVPTAKKGGGRTNPWIQTGWVLPKSRSEFGTWWNTPTSPGRNVWLRPLGPRLASWNSMLRSPRKSRLGFFPFAFPLLIPVTLEGL